MLNKTSHCRNVNGNQIESALHIHWDEDGQMGTNWNLPAGQTAQWGNTFEISFQILVLEGSSMWHMNPTAGYHSKGKEHITFIQNTFKCSWKFCLQLSKNKKYPWICSVQIECSGTLFTTK